MSDDKKRLLGQDGKPLKLEERQRLQQFLSNAVYFAKEKSNFIVSVLAFLISLISLVFSIRNTAIFKHQVSIEQAEYISSINAIWRGEIDSKKKEIKIVASKSNILLQRGLIYFPREFKEFREVYPPNNSFPLIPISYMLESYARESAKNYNIGKDNFVFLESSIPMLIDSNYTVDGSSFYNKGIYSIRYVFSADSNKLFDSDIEIKGVSYIGRLPYQQDSQTAIDIVWQTWKEQWQIRKEQ
jgi:hypothetical protein